MTDPCCLPFRRRVRAFRQPAQHPSPRALDTRQAAAVEQLVDCPRLARRATSPEHGGGRRGVPAATTGRRNGFGVEAVGDGAQRGAVGSTGAASSRRSPPSVATSSATSTRRAGPVPRWSCTPLRGRRGPHAAGLRHQDRPHHPDDRCDRPDPPVLRRPPEAGLKGTPEGPSGAGLNDRRTVLWPLWLERCAG